MGEDKTMFIMFRGEQLLFTGLGIGERWRTLSDEAELRGDGGKEAADTTTHTKLCRADWNGKLLAGPFTRDVQQNTK